jgi:type I restriction enzyme R subunit
MWRILRAASAEAIAGRTEAIGADQGSDDAYDYVTQLASIKAMCLPGPATVEGINAAYCGDTPESIRIIDFWKKPIEVKRLRGNIDTEILLANIPQLTDLHERIAVEIVKLAEKRHEDLTK